MFIFSIEKTKQNKQTNTKSKVISKKKQQRKFSLLIIRVNSSTISSSTISSTCARACTLAQSLSPSNLTDHI